MADEQPLIFHSREHFIELHMEGTRQRFDQARREREDSRERRSAAARVLLRNALPNFIGTVGGGIVLAALALLAGLVDDVSTRGWVAVIAATAGVILGAAFAARLPQPEPPSEEERRAAAERAYERLSELGVLKPHEPPD